MCTDSILGISFNISEKFENFHNEMLAFLSVNLREKSSTLISFIFDTKFKLFWKEENSKCINWLEAMTDSSNCREFFDFIIDFLLNILKNYYSGEQKYFQKQNRSYKIILYRFATVDDFKQAWKWSHRSAVEFVM